MEHRVAMPDGSEPRDIWTAKPPTPETTDIPRAAAPIHHEPGLFLNLFSQTDLIFKRTTSETRTSGHREGSEPSHRGVDSTADKCPRRLRLAAARAICGRLGTLFASDVIFVPEGPVRRSAPPRHGPRSSTRTAPARAYSPSC